MINKIYNIYKVGLLCCGLLAALVSCQDKEYTTNMPEARLVSNIELKVSQVLPLAVGMDTTIVCNVTPEDVDNAELKWTSSDELVATVSEDGTITGHQVGTAVVTVTPAIGFGVQGQTMRTITVRVVPEVIKATDITFTNTVTQLYETDQLQLTWEILPVDHTYDHLIFRSSDETRASVDENGVVTGLKRGPVTIYAYATDKSNVVGSIDLTVKGYVAAQEINITKPESDQLYLGQQLQLDYTLTPVDATLSTVEWESSDESVLRVNQGKITAVGFGSAYITATCAETGYKATLTLNVPSGWYVWDETTDFKGWYCPTSGGKVETKNGHLVVTVGTGNRADIKRQGTFETDFGNYPVFALRMQDVGASFGADFVTTKEFSQPNGITASSAACTPIDLGDGTVLVYVVITKPEVLDGMVPYRSFGFKVTKIGAAHSTYEIYWMRQFKSEAEMKAFVGL